MRSFRSLPVERITPTAIGESYGVISDCKTRDVDSFVKGTYGRDLAQTAMHVGSLGWGWTRRGPRIMTRGDGAPAVTVRSPETKRVPDPQRQTLGRRGSPLTDFELPEARSGRFALLPHDLLQLRTCFN